MTSKEDARSITETIAGVKIAPCQKMWNFATTGLFPCQSTTLLNMKTLTERNGKKWESAPSLEMTALNVPKNRFQCKYP